MGCGRAWTELIWLRTGTSSRLLWTQSWTFGFRKAWVIYQLAEELLTSQECLCCMHLISWLFRKRKYSQDLDLWHSFVTFCWLANVKSIIEILVQFFGRWVLYWPPHHALTFYFLQTTMEVVHKFVVISLYFFSWLCFNRLAAIFPLCWAVSL